MRVRLLFWVPVLALSLAGCGAKPGHTVKKMNEELCATGDMSVMLNHVSEASKPAVKGIVALTAEPAKAAKMKEQIQKDCAGDKAKIDITEEKVEGDRATVTYQQGGKTQTAQLVKENGAWKLVVDNKK